MSRQPRIDMARMLIGDFLDELPHSRDVDLEAFVDLGLVLRLAEPVEDLRGCKDIEGPRHDRVFHLVGDVPRQDQAQPFDGIKIVLSCRKDSVVEIIHRPDKREAENFFLR